MLIFQDTVFQSPGLSRNKNWLSVNIYNFTEKYLISWCWTQHKQINICGQSTQQYLALNSLVNVDSICLVNSVTSNSLR